MHLFGVAGCIPDLQNIAHCNIFGRCEEDLIVFLQFLEFSKSAMYRYGSIHICINYYFPRKRSDWFILNCSQFCKKILSDMIRQTRSNIIAKQAESNYSLSRFWGKMVVTFEIISKGL
jgi:hypothetical protein